MSAFRLPLVPFYFLALFFTLKNFFDQKSTKCQFLSYLWFLSTFLLSFLRWKKNVIRNLLSVSFSYTSCSFLHSCSLFYAEKNVLRNILNVSFCLTSDFFLFSYVSLCLTSDFFFIFLLSSFLWKKIVLRNLLSVRFIVPLISLYFPTLFFFGKKCAQ